MAADDWGVVSRVPVAPKTEPELDQWSVVSRAPTAPPVDQGLAAIQPRPSTPAGFMLRPEFVEQVRSEYGNLPPEQRRTALQEASMGRGVRADAAKRILADLAIEDQRRREITQGREGLMGILAAAQQQPAPRQPAAPAAGPAPRVQFPDVSPTIGDIMDMVPEQERIQRRLAQDEAARTLEAAESSIEATRAREQERMGALEQIGKSFTEVGIPTAEAGFTGLTAVAQQAQMAKIGDQLKELEAQGQGNTPQADRLRRVLEHYSSRQQVYLGDIAQTQAKLSTAPVYRGVRELTEAETFTDAAKAFARNPVSIVMNLTAQSLPSMLPALVLGVINPALGVAAMGGSSYGVEFGNELLGFARDKGFDTTDPQQMAQFMQNPELLREGVNRAGTKAGIVAAGDMLLTGLAAKTLVPKRITGPVAKNVTNVGAQMGVQGVGGAGTEALAQYVTTGEIKPGEVVAEAVGELGGAPAEVFTQTAQARREARAAQQAAPTAEPPAVPPAAPAPSTPPAPAGRVEPRFEERPVPPVPGERVEPTLEGEAPAPAEPSRISKLFEELDQESRKNMKLAPDEPVQEAAKDALKPEPIPPQTELPRQAVVEVPVGQLKLSEDVPQFKAGADKAGIVEPLGGKFERTGVAPIQVWRRTDGRMEIISGRHRFDLAKRSGEKTIPAQIHDESKGFTRDMAAVLDAELNIRDGQGKVKDYVNYFKGTGLDRETANARGLLARAPGKRAFSIANDGSDELIAGVRADQIPDEAAYLIAINAPGDARLQSVGIKAVADGKSAANAVNMMQAVRALAGEADTTTDMFGFDDSAMKEAEEMAKIAGRKQKEIQTRLSAISGAARNPQLAASEGIDIRDPQAVNNRINELRQMKATWDNWSVNPELIAEIRTERGVAPPTLAKEEKEFKPYKSVFGEISVEDQRQMAQLRDSLPITKENQRVNWIEIPNGYAYKQYVIGNEQDRTLIQEVRGKPTKDGREPPIIVRGISQNNVPFMEAEATGKLDEVLSGEAFAQFKEFFESKEKTRGAAPPVLTTQTPEELRAKAEREERARKEEQAKPAEVPPAEEFVLTGSERAADEAAARGQMELAPAEEKAEKPAEAKEPAKEKPEAEIKSAEKEPPEVRQARREMEEMKSKPGYVMTSAELRRRRALIDWEYKQLKGEEAAADAPAKNRLILMPCCDKKGKEKAPAMDLYQGVFFQTFKANVKPDAKPKVVILSAKHGFIDPTKEIEPYDQLMGEDRAQQMLSNLDKQLDDVSWPSNIKDVLIVGGKTYQKVMRAAVAELKERGVLDPSVKVSATSGGIGEQRQQLGEYLRSIPEPKARRAEAPAKEEETTEKKPPLLPVPKGFEPKKGRKTQLVMAARELAAGRITKAEYDQYVEEYLPITTVLGGVMEPPVEDGMMAEILTKKIKQKKDPDKVNAPIADGTRVGLRMDIPALEWGKANGVNGSVVSIHKGAPLENATAGDNLSYRSTGAIKNVKMAIRREDEAFLIAQQAEPELRRKKTGEEYLKSVDEKKPQQTMEGKWVNMSPEETFRLVQQNLDNPDWVQVSLDPLRHSYFYARDSKRPVVAADEALQVGRFVLVKNPVYADREKFLYSLDPAFNLPVIGEAEQRSPSFKREVAKLKGQHTKGLMTDKEFADRIDALIDADARRRFEQQMAALAKDRVRGADFILQKLLEAKRRGEVSEESYKLAQWFIEKNPQLVDELGISIKAPTKGAVAGQYDVNRMIMVLIKGRNNDLTAVHEILHHLERMMPSDIQSAIRKEWTKQLLSAQKKAKTPQEKLYFEALVAHHFGDPIMSLGSIPADLRKLYDESLLKMDVKGQFVQGINLANFLLTTSQVDRGMYQYYSPSEFWAVNGSEIVKGRYDAIKGGLLARLKNWLKELGQKIKSIFGLKSDAPLIRALDSLAKSDGQFVTDEILDQATTLYSIEPTEPEGAAPSRTVGERLRDNWVVSKDELGRTRFTPGAVAYKAAAMIANNVLDRVGMKPISPELGRAMRNMRVQVENVQKKTANLAQELAKMSPQEREMISDVIEGELKAGVQPPENVLNIAASMQELMKRQSDELVRLGMLSKESAQRWEYKYLPRFYLSKLKDDVNAWAKAAKNLIRRQPLMQGVVGKSLKARGMFETIPVEDLQDWIDLGYEQRDPGFDPKTSTETVVWRDYTREERENMGEIRDAMFRFVMGYNASQRDIALGRLYEELADSYASKGPKEGFVQVPDTKVEGTGAYRYGKLAGMYVPSEIMDHLVHNDQELANGVLKIYRAALSRWKEGKTVLNPVAHANNVISNLTMAHFAGVSYWDAQKYAGAVKDMVTNSDLLKEADEVGLFSGSFSQSELVASMPPELQAMANMTESQIAKLGGRIWDLLSYTVDYKGRKIGVRPMAQWMYENEDAFFRFLIYRDARNRGLDPQDARDYSQQFIFTYDDLPRGARALRDFAMPFFAYTYKVIPVLARTALEYPWRYAAPATVAYSVNAMMYAMAAGLGEDEDEWWINVMYKYVTDPEFRAKAKELEQQERRNLPPWLKGESAALIAPKAIRLGMDDVTGMPLFLDISRIFPGGDILDAVNNSGGVALLQPLTPSNPVLTTLVAMLANKDMFFGKDVVKATDTEEEKTQKRLAWLWRQAAPAIAVGNYHFDRGMNVLANITGKPITIDAGPMGIVDYTGVGKDGLPVIPKYAALQTVGIKVRPYDLEVSEKIEEGKQNQLIRELALEISRINRLEQKGAISVEAAERLKSKAQEKQRLLKDGLTVEGKPRE